MITFDGIDFSCDSCKHLNGATCKAFPIEIPDEIFVGDIDHVEPYPGDNGIQFEPIEEPKPWKV